MAMTGWSLDLARLKLPNWKKWNLLKSQFKNITHISDIHFWKFHGFEPRGARCLNPSEMNILGFILDGNNLQISITSPSRSPFTITPVLPNTFTNPVPVPDTPNPKWPSDFDNYKRLFMIRYFTIWTWMRLCGVISSNKIRNYKNSEAWLYFFLFVEYW